MTVNADSQRVGPGAGVDSERRDVESLSPKHSAHTTVVPIPDEETPLISENGTAAPASTEPQWLGGLTTKRFQLLFLQIVIGNFVACFDGTIMASSHPAITSSFGSSNAASWLSTAFLLTSTSFQPVLGSLSDGLGRKSPYVATVAIFLVGTAACALAPSMGAFIAARALCGLGAGGMMTLGIIILSDVVPIEIRGKYQGYLNVVFGVGSMMGAALGGLMADTLGWRWEFGVQVPLLVGCLALSMVIVPADLGLYGREQKPLGEVMRNFDLRGSILMASSVTCLIIGLSLGGNILPWSHPVVIASLVLFAILFPIFLHVESNPPAGVKPVMPIHLLTKQPQSNLLFSNHLAFLVSSAVIFNAPLYFQGVLLTSATTSGLRLVASSVVTSIVGTTTGFLITYTRRMKWAVAGGTAILTAGTALLAAQRPGWPGWVYVLFLVPQAAGCGLAFPGTLMAVLAVAPQEEQAVVTGTLTLWRSLGSVMGVATSSLVMQNALRVYLEKYVSAPTLEEKEKIVQLVRKSVEAIKALPDGYRAQVVTSYGAALRVTFVATCVVAALSMLLVLPVRLPKLTKKT